MNCAPGSGRICPVLDGFPLPPPSHALPNSDPLCPPSAPPPSQALQWLVVFVSLMMHVAAFLSMRSRARPCLIEDEFGNPLVDAYAINR